MKVLSCLLLAPTVAAALLLAGTPTNAAIEAAGLLMTGLGVWRSTRCAGTALPFVQRHGSSVAGCIPRIKTINRVDLSALMA